MSWTHKNNLRSLQHPGLTTLMLNPSILNYTHLEHIIMDVAVSFPLYEQGRHGIQPFKAWSVPRPKRPCGAHKRSVAQDPQQLRSLRPAVIASALSECPPNEMVDRTCAP
jgi:hypothetical protein